MKASIPKIIKSFLIFLLFLALSGCSKSNNTDKESTVIKDGIVLYGHSLFTQWRTAAKDLKPLPITNMAFGGSTTPQLIEQYDEKVLPLKPKLIILNTGVNYLKHHSVEEFSIAFELLLGQIHITLPNTKIVWLTISPSPKAQGAFRQKQIAATNAALKIIEGKDYISTIDMDPLFFDDKGEIQGKYFSKDRVHYNKKVYKAYTKFLKPEFERIWKSIAD
jgi:hypothetical protein